jgi:hypothetical protein
MQSLVTGSQECTEAPKRVNWQCKTTSEPPNFQTLRDKEEQRKFKSEYQEFLKWKKTQEQLGEQGKTLLRTSQ